MTASSAADFLTPLAPLSTGSLLWLTVTLVAYLIGVRCHVLARNSPVVNPVAITIALLVGTLLLTETPYETYFAGAQFIQFLLGPATVSLAIPLYHNRARVKAAFLPMAAALLIGSLTAIVSAVGLGILCGADMATVRSLAPKAATSPIAMGISSSIGGIPSLTAAMVIVTGIVAAMLASFVITVFRLRDPIATGFAIGLAAHGIGTARAFQISPLAGTFAGIGMGLNGVMTAILVPLLASFF